MYNYYKNRLNEIYRNDTKILRSGATLFGHLYEGRWQTSISKGLSAEEIIAFEQEREEVFPESYREFLVTFNGAYLFDLIQIAGKPRDCFKGMSIEEQVNEPAFLDVVRGYEISDSEDFTFAVSMISDTYYAIDSEEKVLELKFNTSEKVNQFTTLQDLLDHVFNLGSAMVEKGEYIEF